jgi:HK97 gp10 family phage protein
MATFTITGVKEIQRAYRELPKRVANKVVRQAVRKALKPMQAKVKELSPKGETGRLARAPKVRARKKVRRGIIALNVQIGEGDFKGETFYGGFQNFGTKKIKAKGYIEAAFEATKDAAAQQVSSEVAAGIVREAIAAARG